MSDEGQSNWLQYDTDGSEPGNDNDISNDINNDNENENEINYIYNNDDDIHNIPVPNMNRSNKSAPINNYELEDWDTTTTTNNNNNNNNNDNNNNNINNYNNKSIINNDNYYNQINKNRYSHDIPEVAPFSLWIGKLPKNIQEYHIKNYFNDLNITLVDIRLRYGKKGSMFASAYIDLESKNDIINALLYVDNKNAPLLLGKKIKIDTTEILKHRYNKNGEYYNNDNSNYYNEQNYYNSKSRNVYSKRRNDTKYESQTPKFTRQNKFTKKWSPHNMQRSHSANEPYNYNNDNNNNNNNNNNPVIFDPVSSIQTPKKILQRKSEPTPHNPNVNNEDIKYEEKSNNAAKQKSRFPTRDEINDSNNYNNNNFNNKYDYKFDNNKKRGSSNGPNYARKRGQSNKKPQYYDGYNNNNNNNNNDYYNNGTRNYKSKSSRNYNNNDYSNNNHGYYDDYGSNNYNKSNSYSKNKYYKSKRGGSSFRGGNRGRSSNHYRSYSHY